MICLLLAFLLVLADQLIKYFVRAGIPLGQSVPFLPHVLSLTYVQNTGAAFSVLRGHTWLLTLLSVTVIGAVVWLVARAHITGRWGLFSATLVVAGGVGNLIDRVVLGYVTDMFQTEFMDFAVFNVADCCITVGAAMLILYILLFYGGDHRKEGEDHALGELPADRL